jgi:hypothetical protein
LAFILTVNDPVSLDMVSTPDQGQASGVSATAEQFGGAVGIAGLYVAFHISYVNRLVHSIARSSLPDLTARQALRFKHELLAAEQTGLRPKLFDPRLAHYLPAARSASNHGYVVAVLTVTVLSLIGLVFAARLVRKTTTPAEPLRIKEDLAIRS